MYKMKPLTLPLAIGIVLIILLLLPVGCDGGSPLITNVESIIEGNSAVITWVTNVNATSQVEYGITTEYGTNTDIDATLKTNHSVTINELNSLTTYHFRVISSNANGVDAVSTNSTFTIEGVEISDVVVFNLTPKSATITWKTDIPSTSKVEYGITNAFGSTTNLDTIKTTDHSVTIYGLAPNTTYHFRTISSDDTGTETVSANNTFNTDISSMIVYQAYVEDNWGIFLIQTDGSGKTRLTANTSDNNPSLSPDGQRIVFSSYRDGNKEIYVMDSDGSNQTRLTFSPESDFNPQWSPDGSKIAYITMNNVDSWDICAVNADGSDQTLVANTIPAYGWQWSPDGSKIIFDKRGSYIFKRYVLYDIYVVNEDGSNLTCLTEESESHDWAPVWSPDGTKIAYTHGASDSGDIYIMNADGSEPTNLTDSTAHDLYPMWSPDGTKIAFISSDHDSDDDIYIMNADGTGQFKFTNDTTNNRLQSWTSDGSRIVYRSIDDEKESLWIINADGTGQIKLADIRT